MSTQKETEVNEFELDETVVKSISDAVTAGIAPVIEEKVKSAVDAKVAALEPVINKGVNNDGKSEGDKAKKIGELTKEQHLFKTMIALKTNDKQALIDLNTKAMEYREKLGYGNEGVAADGGYAIALPEFEAEIERLEPQYGIALREADVRNIRSNKIWTNKLGSNVTMYETSEGGQKQGTKMTISQAEVTLRKFAAIAPFTDELNEDSAVDFWNELAQGFAQERARLADVLVLTENGSTYKGILHTAGVSVETVGAAITSIVWDDLLNAEAKIPTAAQGNMKHVMHRSVWNVLRQNKDSQGRYQAMPSANLNGLATPWGTPVVLSDAMPSITDVPDANEGYVITGDLKRAKLYVKGGLVLDRSNEATVHDANGNAVNLFEKDMSALRAVTRMVALIKFPEAFCVIGTGTVS